MRTAHIPTDYQPAPDSLQDKVILVTGATGGYGKTMSLAYARAGATVILLGKNVRLLENLYDEIEAAGAPMPAIYPLNLEGATEKDYYDMGAMLYEHIPLLGKIISMLKARLRGN